MLEHKQQCPHSSILPRVNFTFNFTHTRAHTHIHTRTHTHMPHLQLLIVMSPQMREAARRALPKKIWLSTLQTMQHSNDLAAS